MSVWSLLLAATVAAAAPPPTGRYVAVTETEYELELVLNPSGDAELKSHEWEPGEYASGPRSRLKGHWSTQKGTVLVAFPSGKTVSFHVERCLSHSEFGGKGCSPGLKLIKTNLPAFWGLQRFGLWRSDQLKLGA
ncbi:hypothetical protein [Cognatilysobacter terrigena]|uniref:hypothetical protein n=1 Tax=Cognatilysobacter terrigena TaxID=2488749 RepID=UPI00105B430C|nr:hypothetical protein [Lysobacter terrigena]